MADFKKEVQAALESGQDHGSLLALVHRHLQNGLSSKACYEALQKVWLERGFAETEEPSPLREELEYLMERVWYQETR